MKHLLPFIAAAAFSLYGGAGVVDDAWVVTGGAGRGGIQRLADGSVLYHGMRLNSRAKEVSFPGVFAHQEGQVEVLISTGCGRVHEALLLTQIRPLDVQTGLILLGGKNAPLSGNAPAAWAGKVWIYVEWTDDDGIRHRAPVESWLLDRRTRTQPKDCGWRFVGSPISKGVFLADQEGNVALTWNQGAAILAWDDPEAAGVDDLVAINPEAGFPIKNPEVTIILKLGRK